jgi:hypothetical protein
MQAKLDTIQFKRNATREKLQAGTQVAKSSQVTAGSTRNQRHFIPRRQNGAHRAHWIIWMHHSLTKSARS